MKAGDIVVNKINQKSIFVKLTLMVEDRETKTSKFCNILEGENFHGKNKTVGWMGGNTVDKQSFARSCHLRKLEGERRGIICLAMWRRRTLPVEGTAACETGYKRSFGMFNNWH